MMFTSIPGNIAPERRTGGQVLVDRLIVHGADCAFCVPGESYLAVLDALYSAQDRFKLYNARHKAGAANMAEAYGKLTGKPGICLVTRGPGACHAAIGGAYRPAGLHAHTLNRYCSVLIMLQKRA